MDPRAVIPTWADVMPDYRRRWEDRNPHQHQSWEEAELGYHYAWGYRSRPENQGRTWEESEPELERGWGAFERRGDRVWADVRDTVRTFWDEHAKPGSE